MRKNKRRSRVYLATAVVSMILLLIAVLAGFTNPWFMMVMVIFVAACYVASMMT